MEGRGRERKGRGGEGREGGDAPPTATPGSALARTQLMHRNKYETNYAPNVLYV